MRRLRAFTTVLIIVGLGVLAPALASAAGPALDVRTTGGTPIDTYNYLVNEDNAADPGSSDPFQQPGFKPDASNSPVVHTGIVAPGDTADATLPDLPAGKYLITVRAPGYKLWGRHVTLPAASPIRIELSSDNVPAASLIAHVFEDSQSVNAAPDVPLESGLAGFDVILEDTVGQVTVDIDGEALCGGQCLTDASGNVTIHNLPPGKYEVSAIPPDGEGWIQTSTFEGKFSVAGWLEEGADGRGPEAEALVGPPGTANWFGFVKEEAFEPAAGTGTITGTARTWAGWPPGLTQVLGDPVPEPYVALSALGGNDQQVYTGRGNPNGSFEIPDVPPGTYQLSIWDYDLDWIIRLVTVDVGPNETVALGDVGVWRWFGWMSGFVFDDNGAGAGATANDGIRQAGEPGIRAIDLDVRNRDGSVQKATFTDNSGRYEYPELLSVLSKFSVAEVGFGRHTRTGISLAGGAPLDNDVGGGLLAAQLTQFGHRSEVDFGKRPYTAGENGGISGIVYYATTRNETDARLQAAEDYEPGIPGATVKLYVGPGESRDVIFVAPPYHAGSVSGSTPARGPWNTYRFANRSYHKLNNNGSVDAATGLGGMVTEVRVYQNPLPAQTRPNQTH